MINAREANFIHKQSLCRYDFQYYDHRDLIHSFIVIRLCLWRYYGSCAVIGFLPDHHRRLFKSQGNIPPLKSHFYSLQTKHSVQTRSRLCLTPTRTHQRRPGAVSVLRLDTQFHHKDPQQRCGFDIADLPLSWSGMCVRALERQMIRHDRCTCGCEQRARKKTA